MKHEGIRGVALLTAFSASALIMLGWGGGWELAAKIMTAILTGALGILGVVLLVRAWTAEPPQKCYICGVEADRYCDYTMADDSDCARYACHHHLHAAGPR